MYIPQSTLQHRVRHAVRAYFGSKIAFYFAWAETYTCWLICIVLCVLPLELFRAAVDDPTVDVYLQATYSVALATCDKCQQWRRALNLFHQMRPEDTEVPLYYYCYFACS